MAIRTTFIVDGKQVSEREWKKHRRKKAKALGLDSGAPSAPAVRVHKWPIVSDIYGVLPNQIEEARRIDRENGTPMQYVESGDQAGAMVIRSKQEFDRWNKRRQEMSHNKS